MVLQILVKVVPQDAINALVQPPRIALLVSRATIFMPAPVTQVVHQPIIQILLLRLANYPVLQGASNVLAQTLRIVLLATQGIIYIKTAVFKIALRLFSPSIQQERVVCVQQAYFLSTLNAFLNVLRLIMETLPQENASAATSDVILVRVLGKLIV